LGCTADGVDGISKSERPWRKRYHTIKYRPLNDLLRWRVLVGPLASFVSNSRTTVKSPDDGDSITLQTFPNRDQDPTGWTIVETILIRSDIRYTPSGRFPVHINKSSPGTEYLIGCDAAVCVQRYEPWIIETYNTSVISPSALRIVERGYSSTPLLPSGSIRGAPIANTRNLNTTKKYTAFALAYGSSVLRLLKDNGQYRPYYPYPTVGSAVSPPTPSPLTSTHSAARFFHRRRWTRGIYRTLSRPTRHYPRTDQCGQRSTIPRGVGAARRTIVRE